MTSERSHRTLLYTRFKTFTLITLHDKTMISLHCKDTVIILSVTCVHRLYHFVSNTANFKIVFKVLMWNEISILLCMQKSFSFLKLNNTPCLLNIQIKFDLSAFCFILSISFCQYLVAIWQFIMWNHMCYDTTKTKIIYHLISSPR